MTDTSVPGPSGWPSTRWTMLLSTADRSAPAWQRSWEELARLYWRPIFLHIRHRWNRSVEDAKDLTQDFFAWLIEGDALARADADRGRFRTFARACLDNFLRDESKYRSREKRGGGSLVLALDALPTEVPSCEPYDREWKRVTLERATEELARSYREAQKDKYWLTFEAHYLRQPPLAYGAIAAELGISESDVTNYLHHARTELRRLVQSAVRDTVATDGEVSTEYRDLFET